MTENMPGRNQWVDRGPRELNSFDRLNLGVPWYVDPDTEAEEER